MRGAGYSVAGIPADADALMGELSRGVTNELAGRNERTQRVTLPLARYRELLETLPAELRRAVEERWGQPEEDPHVQNECFVLAILPLGNVVIGLQPARGYHVDPKRTYHAPDLVPPHGYLAFYLWLRHELEAARGRAPGQARQPGMAAGQGPRAVQPLLAGGGAWARCPISTLSSSTIRAKAPRRSGVASAVIIDHLTPPLTRAESYGPLRELEQLLDEYAMSRRASIRAG